ncbi:MAG: pentapeptide repeat-containing protein [Cyanobacteriota bacterium]
MQVQNFLDRYRQGERDFAYIDLSGAILMGVNLRNINLTGANLSGANLSWAQLGNAQLTGAYLHQANLHSATLNHANLNQATLSRANLTKVDLRLATLRGANLNWADLTTADLSGADLQKAQLSQANLEQAKLNDTQLREAELMEANLRRATLSAADLTGANLREANLEQANLREALLVGAKLAEANLTSAYLRTSNLSNADLHRAILVGVDMSEANCERADLSRANLTGAYLLKASFRQAELLRAVLQDVLLLRTDLSQANLRRADLRQADLSGAYLKDTILSEANLTDAYFLESHLIRTKLDRAEMTGCCIHSWHLEDVDLSDVECRYVFTGFDYSSKKPCDRYPSTGELPQGALSDDNPEEGLTIEVQFSEAPNWEALVFTLTQVELECSNLQLTSKFYQLKSGQSVLRLTTNRWVNTKIISQRILQLYPEMLQRFAAHRPIILNLLQIKEIGNSKIEPLPQKSPIPAPLIPIANRRRHLYQEVVTQIQRIIMSQSPQQCVESVERLLEFLKRQNISTEEIQKKVIGQVIMKRAETDQIFQKQLLEWQESADETTRFSVVGQAVRLAIALIES